MGWETRGLPLPVCSSFTGWSGTRVRPRLTSMVAPRGRRSAPEIAAANGGRLQGGEIDSGFRGVPRIAVCELDFFRP